MSKKLAELVKKSSDLNLETAKELKKLGKDVKSVQKIQGSQGKDIANLECTQQVMRDRIIVLESRMGATNKELADQYNLSESRISQIKSNSKNN